MIFTVQLWMLNADDTSSIAVIHENLSARKSLKMFHQLCAIGRAYVKDGEWHRWQADRISENKTHTIIGASKCQ